MGLMKKMFMSCREMTDHCASEEVPNLSLAKRIKFRLHLQMCKACRAYYWTMEKMSRQVESDFKEYKDNHQHEIEKTKKGLKKNL